MRHTLHLGILAAGLLSLTAMVSAHGVTVLGRQPAAPAPHTLKPCAAWDLSDLRGTYAFTATGSQDLSEINPALPKGYAPLAIIGAFKLNGNGDLTGWAQINAGGVQMNAEFVNSRFSDPTPDCSVAISLSDPEKEYFADGVTDALITELARIPVVRVISRQSVLHLKASNRKLSEIARDLGADGVVEGAVLHEGQRARLTAPLMPMEPERHAWAQSYECDVSAVLTTQRDVAGAIGGCIATALKVAGAVIPPRTRMRASPISSLALGSRRRRCGR
jgi:TolB-like protein